jgi:uncharacterized damage-inducible protein DinB
MKSLLLRYAGYHVWAMEEILRRSEPIPDPSYRANLGAFYRSIHGTLNHILLTDRIWMGRLTGNLYPFQSLDQEVESDRAALGRALLDQARRWTGYIESQPDSRFPEIFAYKNAFGKDMSVMYGGVLLHVFNHSTHHRGQISTMITHLGFQVPEMDLPDFLRLPV